MSRTIGNSISPDVPLSCGQGPTLIIWCTAGVSGMLMPAMSPILGLQTPHAITTCSASMSPPLVRTRRIRPSETSSPVTSTVGTTVSAPDSRALSRMIVPARKESTTPTDGVQNAPMIWSGSRNGTFSATNAGLTSSASMPHARAEDIRRRSSSMRSSVRATSKPPDRVNTPISRYCRTLSRVRSVISREWSTGKMKFEAWPVEPPGLGSGPLSIWTMSVHPSRARWCTRLLPTMPAPITTTRAVGGTEAIGGTFPGRALLLMTQRSALSATRFHPASARAALSTLTGRSSPRDHAVLTGSTDRADPSGDALEPGVDLGRVGVHPLLGGRLGVHLVLGDVLRDEVLVVVGPLEVLHQLVARAVVLGELGRHHLVEVVGRVVAGDLRGVRVTAGGVLRQRDVLQRHLGEEPLRVVEVADQPLVVLLRAPEGLDQGRLAAGVHDLEVQVEVLDQRLVVGDEGRVAVEELALATGLGGLELVGVLVQVLPVEDVGMRLGEPRRDVPADDPLVAVRAGVHRGLVALHVLLHEVGVTPVLDDHVDLAAAEALPGDLLLEVLVGHLAAELRLGEVADDVRGRLVAHPRVDGHVEVATAAAAGGLRGLDVAAPAAGQHETRDGNQCCQRAPSCSHEDSLSCCAPMAGSRVLGDPVEHDAECRDRDTGSKALPEELPLAEAGDDEVAEATAADQATDDDHRQHVQQSLVHREHDGGAGHRQLHLADHLPGGGAGGPSGLHRGRCHA